jgi:hypothetical protein
MTGVGAVLVSQVRLILLGMGVMGVLALGE